MSAGRRLVSATKAPQFGRWEKGWNGYVLPVVSSKAMLADSVLRCDSCAVQVLASLTSSLAMCSTSLSRLTARAARRPDSNTSQGPTTEHQPFYWKVSVSTCFWSHFSYSFRFDFVLNTSRRACLIFFFCHFVNQ